MTNNPTPAAVGHTPGPVRRFTGAQADDWAGFRENTKFVREADYNTLKAEYAQLAAELKDALTIAPMWLLIGDGEGCAESVLANTDAEIIDFLWNQCGPDDSGDEQKTRAYWKERLFDSDGYWQSRDGYPRWRCEFEVGETGHITIQRITNAALSKVSP